MKRWALVLGCYGLMVGSAEAGRWPADVCKELARVRGILESSGTPVAKANQRFAVLLLQGDHCGVAVDADLAADQNTVGRRSAPAQRQPLHCDTTPKAYGGSYLDCF